MLSTNIIKVKLSSVSSNTKDNEAQNIINKASPSELKNLDAEGVLRLYEALAMTYPRVYSSRDRAAMKRLRTYTQYQPILFTPDYGVNLVKSACRGQPIVQSQLTSKLISRLYIAEKKRLSWGESWIYDGKTIGRGQLGQTAYIDVKSPSNFQGILETCLTKVYISELLKRAENSISPSSFANFNKQTYKIIIPPNYSDIYRIPALEDIVVAGYIALKIKGASKAGRSPQDTLRFAIAVYHGMYNSLVKAQNIVGDKINWVPVEAELIKQGKLDQVAYINEVVL